MRLSVLAAAVSLSVVGLVLADESHASMKQSTHIPPQPLGAALQTLAKDRGFQVVYESAEIAPLRTNGAAGDLTSEEALTQLLSGTGMTYKFYDENAVSILPVNAKTPRQARTESANSGAPGADPSKGEGKDISSSFRLAQEAQGASTGPSPVDRDSDQQASQKKPVELQEIVVTGSLIRGQTPTSPLVVIDQDYIKQSGYASVKDLIYSLPENSGAGLNDISANVSPSPLAGNNPGLASSPDIHGLGSEATLTLLNGHRLAASGYQSAPDISAIPLSAIDRVEILTDGASSIYGSDAVAGVVNFILKKNYEGADVTGQYGSVTKGHMTELRFSALGGQSWSGGNILVSLEHYQRDPLDARDRSFSNSLAGPSDLTAHQGQNSAFLHVSQDLGTDAQVFGDALYSSQHKDFFFSYFTPYVYDQSYRTPTLSTTIGLTANLPFGWTLDASANYGYNTINETISFHPGEGVVPEQYKNETISADVKISGTLFVIEGGPVKAAIGAEERREQLDDSSVGDFDRSISAVFSEMTIPLIGKSNSTLWAKRLLLNLSGRFEQYSDFGSSTNPKLGIAWSPSDSLTTRASVGRSFKAPNLYDLHSALYASTYQVEDPQSSNGNSFALVTNGGNPDLRAQTARTWTVGIDYLPTQTTKASLTYFNTSFKDRIQLPTFGQDYLSNSGLSSFVIRNPNQALLQEMESSAALYSNYAAVDNSQISAFFNDQTQNIGRYKTDGLDGSVSDREDTQFGALSASLNISYLLHLEEQPTDLTPQFSIRNEIFYTPALKARGTVSWSRYGLTTLITENFVGSYNNDTVDPLQSVRAQETTDLGIHYNFLQSGEPMSGVSISLDVRNVFDRPPPYVMSPDFAGKIPFGFDPSNGDPVGRFVTISLTKQL